MVLLQEVDQLLRKVCCELWEAFGDVRDEVDEVSQRNDPGLCCRVRRLSIEMAL